MSQRDLPLWARGLAAVLLLVTSWWLLQTEAVRGIVGTSVALIGLGVVGASILRGMHVPLAFWPAGPWRASLSLSAVIAVALCFAFVIALANPEAEDLTRPIDPGMFLITMTGVVVWGGGVALVRQRGYLRWYGMALAAALVPVAVGVTVLAVRSDAIAWCLVALGDETAARCADTGVEAFGFTFAVQAAAVLVTLELVFRRLLIGQADRAGLILILVAAMLFSLWAYLIGPEALVLGPPWWLATLSAVGAGCIYGLSRSLFVSSLYTAAVFAGHQGLTYGVQGLPSEGSPLMTFGWSYPGIHLIVVLVLAAALARRRGLVTGLG